MAAAAAEEEDDDDDWSAGASALVSVLAKKATAAERPAEMSLAAGEGLREGLLLLLLLRRSARRLSRGWKQRVGLIGFNTVRARLE